MNKTQLYFTFFVISSKVKTAVRKRSREFIGDEPYNSKRLRTTDCESICHPVTKVKNIDLNNVSSFC